MKRNSACLVFSLEQTHHKRIIMRKIRLIFIVVATPVLLTMMTVRKKPDITKTKNVPNPDSEAFKALEFWTAQRAYPQRVIPD